MSGRIVTPDLYRRMPWKNGGGETIEIAKFPPDSDLDSFSWRISTATVASDGPFSTFAGIDRTLCVLSGNGISLTFGSDEPLVLNENMAPFSFSADASATARLIKGPITDLNVMTRRAGWHQEVHRRQVRTGDALLVEADVTWTVVFCRSGAMVTKDETGVSRLPPMGTLLIEGGANPCKLRAIEPTIVFVILLEQTAL
jgi:environmental stress-induced protein Ves